MAAYARSRRLGAEFVGTAGLLAVVVGSGIMGERLAGGNAALALLANEIASAEAALFVTVQVLGGLVGVLVAHAMFEAPAIAASTTVRTGLAQWLSEGVATFGLVATILGCLAARPSALAYAVGLYIGAGYWFTASTSFANPAVTLARTLTDSFSGIRPTDAPGFIIAQAVGAALATALFLWFEKRT